MEEKNTSEKLCIMIQIFQTNKAFLVCEVRAKKPGFSYFGPTLYCIVYIIAHSVEYQYSFGLELGLTPRMRYDICYVCYAVPLYYQLSPTSKYHTCALS